MPNSLNPGCSCCCTFGVEQSSNWINCDGIKVITSMRTDLVAKLAKINVLVIGVYDCGTRSFFTTGELATIKSWIQAGGKAVYMGEYNQTGTGLCASDAQIDAANDQLAALGSVCSLAKGYACNCNCTNGTSFWQGTVNTAVPLMSRFTGFFHACTNKVLFSTPADWIVRTEVGFTSPTDGTSENKCNVPYTMATIEKIGQGFLIVTGDCDLFDCNSCGNKPFWLDYCTKQGSEIYGS